MTKLGRVLKDQALSDAEAARRVGCSAVTVNLVRRGQRLIGLELALRFRVELGIPVEALPLTKEARRALRSLEERHDTAAESAA